MRMCCCPRMFPIRPASREERDLFGGGPGGGTNSRTGHLMMNSRTLRLAAAAMAMGWLPLCLLTACQSLVTGDASLHSFLTDYGALARSLVAAPLLILGQAVAAPQLGAIVRYFREAGLVRTADVSRYHDIVRSTRRLRGFVAGGNPLAIAGHRAGRGLLDRAGAIVAVLASSGGGNSFRASWWHEFVSLPILCCCC